MGETSDSPGFYRTIRELSGDERPRERLLKHGPSVLSDAELVAIVLGSGVRGENVVDLARRLLEAHGGLAGLVRADTASLQRTRGLGPAKAAQLAAAIELGRRGQGVEPGHRPLVTSPAAVHALLGGRLLGKTREQRSVAKCHPKAHDASHAQPTAPSRNLCPNFRRP